MKISITENYEQLNETIQCTDSGLEAFKSKIPEQNLKKGTVHIALIECDSFADKSGSAYTASVCNDDNRKAAGFVSWNDNDMTLAQLIAHEIGNTLGMRHDFQSWDDDIDIWR